MSVRPTIMVITACPLFTTGPLDFFISDLGCTNLEDSKIPEFGSAGEHAKLNLSWIGFSWKNETTSSVSGILIRWEFATTTTVLAQRGVRHHGSEPTTGHKKYQIQNLGFVFGFQQ